MPTVTRQFETDGKIYTVDIEYDLSLNGDTIIVDLAVTNLVLPPEPEPIPEPEPEPTPILEIAEIDASASQPNSTNIPENVIDGNPATRWSAQGSGQWIEADLGKKQSVSGVGVHWYRNDQRKTDFEVRVSDDKVHYGTVIARRQSDQPATPGIEQYMFAGNITARYVRILAFGNTVNDWNSINELEVYGTEIPDPVLEKIMYDVEGGEVDNAGNIKGTTADEFTLTATATNNDTSPRPSQELKLLVNGAAIQEQVSDSSGKAVFKHKFGSPGQYSVEVSEPLQ